MFGIILIDKSGTITHKQVKSFDKLHTTCNYRNNNNFGMVYSWKVDTDTVYELYGKTVKKANTENVYTFRDVTTIYYGNLCLIKKVHDMPYSITLKEWENYNTPPVHEETEQAVEADFVELPYTVSDDKELLPEEYEDE